MAEKQYRALVNRIEKMKQSARTAQQKGLSRREFLKLAGAGGLTLGMSKFAPKVMAQSPKTIIVIGAGASGIACARELQDGGHTVIVLEARDRIGGRIWTDTRLANTPLDLGASWIHGITNNPVWELTQEYGISTIPTDYEDTFAYSADGDVITQKEIEEIDSLLEMVLEEVDTLREEAESDVSLRDLVGQALANIRMESETYYALEAALIIAIENEYANSLEGLSAYYWDDAEDFDGDDVIFPNGYIQVFQNLADGLDIRLNQIVSEIKYTPEGVTLITQTERYNADKVVVTVPLGVLKQNKIAFSPPLPDAKQTAIQRLGMGALNKVYLLFSEVFWSEENQFFTIADSTVQFIDWVNFYSATGKPILMAFYSGRNQASIEAMEEADIINSALAVLGNIFDGVQEAYLMGIATRWGNDPFAYGSYSSYAVGSVPEDREILAQPLDGVLYFAGEATRTDHPSTVHGAVMSGYDVAEIILGE